MEFLKKHWVKIVIALLIIFGLNKCTVACNRDSIIDKQTVEIMQKDSIIRTQSDSLNILKIRWNDAQNSQNTYQGIAIGNQQELFKQIDALTSEKENLTKKVNSLTKENNQLRRQLSNK